MRGHHSVVPRILAALVSFYPEVASSVPLPSIPASPPLPALEHGSITQSDSVQQALACWSLIASLDSSLLALALFGALSLSNGSPQFAALLSRASLNLNTLIALIDLAAANSDPSLIERIAGALSRVPRSISAHIYYRILSHNLLQLFELSSQFSSNPKSKVNSRFAALLCARLPRAALSSFILPPVFHILQRFHNHAAPLYAGAPPNSTEFDEITRDESSQAIERCVSTVAQLIAGFGLGSAMEAYIPALFRLYSFACATLSHLASTLKEILASCTAYTTVVPLLQNLQSLHPRSDATFVPWLGSIAISFDEDWESDLDLERDGQLIWTIIKNKADALISMIALLTEAKQPQARLAPAAALASFDFATLDGLDPLQLLSTLHAAAAHAPEECRAIVSALPWSSWNLPAEAALLVNDISRALGVKLDACYAAAKVEEIHSETLSAIIKRIQDPLLPSRAHGLMQLRKFVLSKDPLAQRNLKQILALFSDHMRHSESYVYLPAINGLAALADVQPLSVIPLLCDMFLDQSLSIEHRVCTSEA